MMFRATSSLQGAVRRLPLTTKQNGKDFYKGTGTGSMGRHTKRGGYIVDYRKVRTYVCPDLSSFELTPFVTRKVKPAKGYYPSKSIPEEGIIGYSGGPYSGKRYLERWKEENGQF